MKTIKKLFKLNKNFKHESGAGFSLIEMVIVLAIFTLIMAVTIDIFTSVVQHQKRILAEQELLNQTSFVTEYISKPLRTAAKDINGSCLGATGSIYLLTHCNNGTSEACNGVKFINQLDNNACQEFFLDDMTDPANPVLKEIKDGSAAQNILSDKFKIKYARFVIDGDKSLHVAPNTNIVQPRITILLDVQAQTTEGQQEKIIQTTISSRDNSLFLATPTPTPIFGPDLPHHFECSALTCVVVYGTGIDQCASDLDCGATPTPIPTTHLACVASTCVSVSGTGIDECASDLDCGFTPTPTPVNHLECLPGGICGIVDGVGPNMCNSDFDCATPTPTPMPTPTNHLACSGSPGFCQLSPGPGPDTCSSDSDCQPPPPPILTPTPTPTPPPPPPLFP